MIDLAVSGCVRLGLGSPLPMPDTFCTLAGAGLTPMSWPSGRLAAPASAACVCTGRCGVRRSGRDTVDLGWPDAVVEAVSAITPM